jgi:hypothetical protein
VASLLVLGFKKDVGLTIAALCIHELCQRCLLIPFIRVNTYNDELPDKEVEDTTEYECDKRTTEDYDIVRHAKVGSGEVDEKCRSIDAADRDRVCRTIAIVFQRGDDSRWQIPSALRIRRMFSIPKE